MKINLFQKFVFDENIDSQKDNLFLKNIFFSKNDFFKKFLLVPLPFFYFLNIYQTNTPFIKFKFNNIKYLKYLNLLYDGIFAVGEKAIRSYQDFGITSNIYNTPYSIKAIYSEFRKEKLNFTTIKFLSSGSLIKRKGHDIVIEAFNLLNKEQSKKVELTILGDGPELRNLKKILQVNL